MGLAFEPRVARLRVLAVHDEVAKLVRSVEPRSRPIPLVGAENDDRPSVARPRERIDCLGQFKTRADGAMELHLAQHVVERFVAETPRLAHLLCDAEARV
jgi:hypothetical protein